MKILVSLILGVMFVATASLSRAEILLQNPGGSYSPLASISAANTSAQVAGKTVIITSPYTISTDTVLRNDCTWKIEKGGLLTIASGKTLTFQNQPQIPDGVQAFAGTGLVAGLTEAQPEWFGDVSSAFGASFNKAGASVTNGGRVVLTADAYTAETTLFLYSKVHYIGAGKNATIVQAKAGLNATLVKTLHFDTNTGTNTLGGEYSFSLEHIVFDGNKSGNTSGEGMQLYGYSFRLNDVVVRNCAGNGLVTEWTTSPNSPTVDLDFEEVSVSNVSVHDNNGNGIVWGGSHDSTWNNVIVFRNSGTYNVEITGGGAPLYMVNCHFWGNGVDYALYARKRVMATNCVAEGAQTANVYFGQNNSSWYGGEVFGAGALTSKGFEIASGLSGIEVVTQTRDCLSGAVVINGTAPSASKIILNNYQASGTPRSGNIPVDGVFIFNSTGVSGYNLTRFGSVLQVIDNVGTLRNIQANGEVSIATVGGSQTIDVLNKDMLSITSAVAATIYNFTNGGAGQTITLLFQDSNTTIQNGSTIKLSGGTNFVSTANDTLRLKYSSVLGAWVEVGRSLN